MNVVEKTCYKTGEPCSGPITRELYSVDSFVNCACLAEMRSKTPNIRSESAFSSPTTDSQIISETSNVS